MDSTEARHREWQWHQLGHKQVCILLQTGNHASSPALSFLQARCPSCRPTNSVKALKAAYLPVSVKVDILPINLLTYKLEHRWIIQTTKTHASRIIKLPWNSLFPGSASIHYCHLASETKLSRLVCRYSLGSTWKVLADHRGICAVNLLRLSCKEEHKQKQ